MIDRSNEIFTKVKTSVSSLCPNSTQTIGNSISKFPTTAIINMDSPEDPKSLTLNDFKERAIACNIEIRTFTTGTSKLQQGKKIQYLACDKLKTMGFSRTYGITEIENVADTDVCVLISRHSRLVGADDELGG